MFREAIILLRRYKYPLKHCIHFSQFKVYNSYTCGVEMYTQKPWHAAGICYRLYNTPISSQNS